MPILTPAYPSMNSSFNVSELTLKVMNEEFKRALKIIQETFSAGGTDWDAFFAPTDFFAVHQHYLAVDIYTTNADDEAAWCSFCESRLRKLVDSLAYIPPLRRIRAFPKKFPLISQCTPPVTTTAVNNISKVSTALEKDKDSETLKDPENPMMTTPTTTTSVTESSSSQAPPLEQPLTNVLEEGEEEEPRFGVSFFVAFDVEKKMLRNNNKELHIDSSVDYFKQNDLYRWPKRVEGMECTIKPLTWKNLPEEVFEELGGRHIARGIRREFLKQKKEAQSSAGTLAVVPSPATEASLDTEEPTPGTLEEEPTTTTSLGEELSQEPKDDHPIESTTPASAPTAVTLSKKRPLVDEASKVSTTTQSSAEEKDDTPSGTLKEPQSLTPGSTKKKQEQKITTTLVAPTTFVKSKKKKMTKMKISFGKK